MVNQIVNYSLPGTLKKIFDYDYWKTLNDKSESFPLFNAKEYLNAEKRSLRINFLSISIDDISEELLTAISNDKFCVFVLKTDNKHGMAEQRRVFIELLIKILMSR